MTFAAALGAAPPAMFAARRAGSWLECGGYCCYCRWHAHIAAAAGSGASSTRQPRAQFRGILPPLAPIDNAAAVRDGHAVSVFANWVVPGWLMVGRYPHLPPDRGKTGLDGASADRQVQMLVQCGCRTFLSLQAEIPSQADMLGSGGTQNGFTQYMTAASEAVRQTQREGSPEPEEARPNFLHFPIVDFGVPEFDQLVDFVDGFSDALLAEGPNRAAAYVHCWGGKGRSGLVAACLLSRWYGLSAAEALLRVDAYCRLRSLQTATPPTNPASSAQTGFISPETPAQREMVRAYICAGGQPRQTLSSSSSNPVSHIKMRERRERDIHVMTRSV
jgi:hypothetical protein